MTVMLAPRRMFLGELPIFVEENSKNNIYQIELRLMGRITYVSRQSASVDITCQPIDQTQQQDNDMTILVIDDGTASLDLVSISKEQVKMGQLIDCIGHLEFAPETQERLSASKPQRNYYLNATSISLVNNPQEELLRLLELSKRDPMLDSAQNTQFSTLRKIPKNRVLTSPHLEQKLNTLHHAMHPFPSITLNSDATYRYIKYSANHGGLSFNELETLVGATINREKRAIREAVEELQLSGMVYIKEGKLFPL